MANETKLLELVNVIGEANDRGEWNQESWGTETACGTTMCAAGWQCVVEGKTLDFSAMYSQMARYAYYTADGYDIENFAKESLELTTREAALLFHGVQGTDYDGLVSTVKNIINGDYR